MTTKTFVLVLLILAFGCTKDPVMPIGLDNIYNYQDSCQLNGYTWYHEASFSRGGADDSVLYIVFSSNYNEKLRKSFFTAIPFRSGKYLIRKGETFDNVNLSTLLFIDNHDSYVGWWELDTNYSSDNYVIIDSISQSGMYVEGQISCHLIDNNYEGRPQIHDPMLKKELHLIETSFGGFIK